MTPCATDMHRMLYVVGGGNSRPDTDRRSDELVHFTRRLVLFCRRPLGLPQAELTSRVNRAAMLKTSFSRL